MFAPHEDLTWNQGIPRVYSAPKLQILGDYKRGA